MIFQLKIMLASFKKNKVWYLVISLTMMLTVAVMIASGNIAGNAISYRDHQFRKNSLNSQIIIKKQLNEDEDFYFLYDEELINKIRNIDGISNVIVRTGGNAFDKSNDEYVNIIGTDMKKQNEVLNFSLKQSSSYLFEKPDALLVNEKYALEWNIKVGDNLVLYSGENDTKFVVDGICTNEGVFSPGVNSFVGDLSTVQKLIGKENEIYSIGITVDELSEIGDILIKLNQLLPNELEAEQTYDLDYFKSYVETVKLSILLVASVFFVVLIYIIYQVQHLVINEKERQNRLLWLNGISKKVIRQEILLENISLTLFSVIVGDLLSLLIIQLTYNALGVKTAAAISIESVLLIDAIVLICTFVSSEFIYFNNKTRHKKKSLLIHCCYFGIAAMMMALSYNTYLVREKYPDEILYIAILGFVWAACVCIHGMIRILFKLAAYLFSNNIFILETRQNITKIIEILDVIIIIIIAFTLSISLKSTVINEINTLSGEMDFSIITSDDSYKEELPLLIDDLIFVEQKVFKYKIDDISLKIYSIDNEYYREYFSSEIIKSGTEAIYKNIDSGKNVIISSTISKLLKKKQGDTININDIEYTITGVVTSFENMGKVIYISNKNYKEDVGLYSYINYMIKSSVDETTVIKKMEGFFEEKKDYESYIQSMREIRKENNDNNKMIFNMVDLLIILCTGICMIGISNNIYISVISRKRSFAVKNIIGIPKKRMMFDIIIEALVVGTVGAISGYLISCVIYRYLIYILEKYVGTLGYSININVLFEVLLIACFVSVLSYCRSAFYIKKLEAVSELQIL